MKKIITALFLSLICLIPSFFNIGNVYAQTKEVKVVSNSCSILSAPHTEATVVKTVNYGEILTLVSDCEIIYGNLKFFHVQMDDNEKTQGYVLTNFVIQNENTSLKKMLDPNAKILKDNTQVFFEANEECKMTIGEENVELTKHQEVKIIDDYDRKKEFCKIMFDKDGTVLTGYVKTSDLSVEGFNRVLILVVFIFVLAISLVVSVVVATKKKRKRQEKTIKNAKI